MRHKVKARSIGCLVTGGVFSVSIWMGLRADPVYASMLWPLVYISLGAFYLEVIRLVSAYVEETS